MNQIQKFVAGVGSSLLVVNFAAVAQSGPVPAAELQNITGCSLDGSDVLVSTGQGADARRYKYPWDASIDALCNAKGFAIASPQRRAPNQLDSRPIVGAPSSTVSDPAEFAAGAVPISGDVLRQAFSDRKYMVSLADGSSWKLEYKANGYFFVNTSTGFNGSGTWKLDAGKLCTSGKDIPSSCGFVQQRGDSLFMKRSSNGEIIEFRPR